MSIRPTFQAAIVLAIGATAHKYLRVRRDDNSVVKTNPAFEGSDLTVCNAWPDGDGELFAGQPFEKPNQGQAIQLESVLNQTKTMNQCADIDASLMLDIDCSGQAKALTDGLLVLRFLFGFREEALTAQAVEGNRTSPADIEAYLESLEPELDLDGDGVVQPLTDGLILMRSLLGFSGEALISGATALNAPIKRPRQSR